MFLIIVTNNFGEIKSTVFKRYEVPGSRENVGLSVGLSVLEDAPGGVV